MSQTIRLIMEHGLIAVIDTLDSDRVLPAALALARGGIKLLGMPATYENVAEVAAELGDFEQLHLGLAHVVNTQQVSIALMVGAQFILASVYDEAIVRMARDRGLVVIAGAATPTEVVTAARASHMVNVFPAKAMGGPDYLAMLCKQFPDIPLLASGGVDVDSAPAYLEAGAAAVIVDSGLVPEPPDTPSIHVIMTRATGIVEVCDEASGRLGRKNSTKGM